MFVFALCKYGVEDVQSTNTECTNFNKDLIAINMCKAVIYSVKGKYSTYTIVYFLYRYFNQGCHSQSKYNPSANGEMGIPNFNIFSCVYMTMYSPFPEVYIIFWVCI